MERIVKKDRVGNVDRNIHSDSHRGSEWDFASRLTRLTTTHKIFTKEPFCETFK